MWELDNNGDFYVGKNQTLTYTHSGVYGISLMATKNGQTITYNKSDYIMVTNEAPVVLDEDYDTLDVAKNQSQRVNLRQIFSDPNGDPLRFAWTGNSHSLSLALEEDSILLVTPGNDYTGVETIFLIAIDNENDSISHKMDVWVSETGILNGIPESFDCSQNYPNPFNPSTEINYQLPENNVVDLSVFNLCGKRVANLVKGYQEAGFYSLNFNASDLPSGMYLYRLTAGNNIITKKMVLMK
jgi:PKD repeat protein